MITPDAVKYEFGGMFDDEIRISLWGYNIETVLAEKTETVLNRGVLNTRPRDYYDIYILRTTQNFDMETYRDALKATSEHRGSIKNITDIDSLLVTISSSQILIDQWEKYRKNIRMPEKLHGK